MTAEERDGEAVASLFLRPGELFFGGPDAVIETLLGSCVSITMWHPRYRIGGMCHYVVPEPGVGSAELVGHSAVGAWRAMVEQARQRGSHLHDYQMKIFGGGQQHAGGSDVGRRNVDVGLALLAAEGLHVSSMHVRGEGARRVALDLTTGHVWLRHRPPTTPGSARRPPSTSVRGSDQLRPAARHAPLAVRSSRLCALQS